MWPQCGQLADQLGPLWGQPLDAHPCGWPTQRPAKGHSQVSPNTLSELTHNVLDKGHNQTSDFLNSDHSTYYIWLFFVLESFDQTSSQLPATLCAHPVVVQIVMWKPQSTGQAVFLKKFPAYACTNMHLKHCSGVLLPSTILSLFITQLYLEIEFFRSANVEPGSVVDTPVASSTEAVKWLEEKVLGVVLWQPTLKANWGLFAWLFHQEICEFPHILNLWWNDPTSKNMGWNQFSHKDQNFPDIKKFWN